MRLWSLHPEHLDARGLVALWREALLAQAVLHGETRGYRSHPQLERFRRHPEPLAAIGGYLDGVLAEADRRGYSFDAAKIRGRAPCAPIPVTLGQLELERRHLLAKLAVRDPAAHERLATAPPVRCHPLFTPVPGEIEQWERAVLP